MAYINWTGYEKKLFHKVWNLYLILSFNQLNNVRRIIWQCSSWASFNILFQQVVNVKLFLSYSKDNIDWIFFDLQKWFDKWNKTKNSKKSKMIRITLWLICDTEG